MFRIEALAGKIGFRRAREATIPQQLKQGELGVAASDLRNRCDTLMNYFGRHQSSTEPVHAYQYGDGDLVLHLPTADGSGPLKVTYSGDLDGRSYKKGVTLSIPDSSGGAGVEFSLSHPVVQVINRSYDRLQQSSSK